MRRDGPSERAFVEAIGRRLQLARKRARLTQDDVAEFAQVTRWSVCRWERGFFAPTLLCAIRLTELYGVSLDWLVGRSKPK